MSSTGEPGEPGEPGEQAGATEPGELVWLRQGTELFAARLSALADADLDAGTGLEGWTRRHLVAHVGYNARALRRLAHWARTGERTPMYASPQARDAEIDEGARLTAEELRALVADSAAELDTALDGLSAEQWQAQVVTAQGRTVPATEIAWMRCREVWIHAVDLGNGARFDDFPADLVDALLTDVTGLWRRRAQEPAVTIAPADRDREWSAESPGGSVAARVTGPAAALAAWVTGRGAAPQANAPALGRWL
jgi:maleylpyruvate isomerase